jgi:hypothetical protein
MAWLLIMIISTTPGYETKGSVGVQFISREKCTEAKQQLEKAFNVEGYRLSATCTVR